MRKLANSVILLGNRHFNYFLVGWKGATIFECGVTAGVESLKYQWARLSPKPEVRYLVAMHAHFDHVCGIPQLRQMFPAARVLASAKAKDVMANAKVVANFFQQDRKMSETLAREGILKEPPRPESADNLVVDRVIEDGESIMIDDNITVEIIDAPGHSPCGLACYLPEEQMMIVSDACGFQISDSTIFPIFFQDYDLYMQTIKRLRTYPARALAIAHERIWQNSNVDALYERALQAAKDMLRDIRKMLNEGKQEETIRQILFQRHYRGNLRIYTPENIDLCVRLLIRRVKQKLGL